MFGLVVSDREDFKIFSPAQAIILIDLEKMFFFFCRGPHKYNSCKVHKTQMISEKKIKMFTDRQQMDLK